MAQENDPNVAQQALEARYAELYQAMLDDPDNLDVMFEFARVATKLGRYEPAISTLERMLVYNQNLPRVRLELGVLYFRIGSYSVAKAYFERVAARDDVPETVQSRVQTYLAKIRSQQARHSFSGSLFVGGRYETNANAGPDDTDVRALGFDAVLDDQFLEQEDFALVTSGFLRHNYDLGTRFQESWQTTGLGYLTRHDDLNDFDVDFFEATTGPRLALAPDSLDEAYIRPYAVGHVVRLDRDLLSAAAGGGVEVSKSIGPRLFARMNYELLVKDFESTSDQPNAPDRSGLENELRGQLNYALTNRVSLNGRLGVRDREADAEFESFTEVFARTGAQLRYKDPFDLGEWPWTLSVSARLSFTAYEEPNPVVDPGLSREDTEYRFAAHNTFRINETFAVELGLRHTVNDSNLPNFEFDNTSVTLGGEVRF